MYLDFGELLAHNIQMTDSARIRAEQSDNCEFCGADVLPPLSSGTERLNWLRKHEPDVLDHAEQHIWYDAGSAAAFDSRVTATVGIPEDLVYGLAEAVSPELLEFVEDRFVFAICGKCMHSDRALREFTTGSALERFVDVHCGANLEFAKQSEDWRVLEELLAYLSVELLRTKGTG